jgi:hypothetical protein
VHIYYLVYNLQKHILQKQYRKLIRFDGSSIAIIHYLCPLHLLLTTLATPPGI